MSTTTRAQIRSLCGVYKHRRLEQQDHSLCCPSFRQPSRYICRYVGRETRSLMVDDPGRRAYSHLQLIDSPLHPTYSQLTNEQFPFSHLHSLSCCRPITEHTHRLSSSANTQAPFFSRIIRRTSTPFPPPPPPPRLRHYLLLRPQTCPPPPLPPECHGKSWLALEPPFSSSSTEGLERIENIAQSLARGTYSPRSPRICMSTRPSPLR